MNDVFLNSDEEFRFTRPTYNPRNVPAELTECARFETLQFENGIGLKGQVLWIAVVE